MLKYSYQMDLRLVKWLFIQFSLIVEFSLIVVARSPLDGFNVERDVSMPKGIAFREVSQPGLSVDLGSEWCAKQCSELDWCAGGTWNGRVYIDSSTE